MLAWRACSAPVMSGTHDKQRKLWRIAAVASAPLNSPNRVAKFFSPIFSPRHRNPVAVFDVSNHTQVFHIQRQNPRW